ncbi:MAG TPA: hypothetical protein VNM46_13150 [Xanthobacteraceae bacterium]|jgi:hypothetical protein|nr:hypothetical protein [Xanthobacteraceae bacterium]
MPGKMLTICEVCGGTQPSGAGDFMVFHCLTFCSPECRDDYQTADEERRAKAGMSRSGAAARTRRSRAA